MCIPFVANTRTRESSSFPRDTYSIVKDTARFSDAWTYRDFVSPLGSSGPICLGTSFVAVVL